MSEFRILHLSDTHIGNPKWETDAADVLKPLLIDIAAEVRQHGKPNLVIFSGDLVFGCEYGKPKSLKQQFNDAKDWLVKLASAVQYEPESLPILFVPGNHDVNRDAATIPLRNYTDAIDPQQVDDRLQLRDLSWKQLIERLEDWKDFAIAGKALPNLKWEEDWLCWHCVIEHDGKKIGIGGLNTSWASYRSSEQGKLWIGERQAQHIWNALESADFKVVVTHHPITWMHPDESATLSQKL